MKGLCHRLLHQIADSDGLLVLLLWPAAKRRLAGSVRWARPMHIWYLLCRASTATGPRAHAGPRNGGDEIRLALGYAAGRRPVALAGWSGVDVARRAGDCVVRAEHRLQTAQTSDPSGYFPGRDAVVKLVSVTLVG